jgi:exopolyphosphatase/guanosine-5'-triphosphate,3'-diphosphate pyrophosphatase
VIATSGTAAALAEASKSLTKTRPAKAAVKTAVKVGSESDSHSLGAPSAEKLTKLDNAARAAVPGIGPRRSEIIVAGAHVFADLLERFALPGFHYSPMGLRDGILAQMLAERDERAPVHEIFERERWEGVLETCRRYGVDPRFAEPVCNHATQLFRDLQKVHELPPEYLVWLQTAAMLRDIGKFMNYQGYHRHAQYIIANSELYGFTPHQRAVTSAIARYLGKSRPAPEGRTMRQVLPADHEPVKRAVVLLRLAVALNQDRASDVLRVTTSGVSEAGDSGADAGADRRRAGAVVAAQGGGLLLRGLPPRASGDARVERPQHSGVEQPVQGGGAAGAIDPG